MNLSANRVRCLFCFVGFLNFGFFFFIEYKIKCFVHLKICLTPFLVLENVEGGKYLGDLAFCPRRDSSSQC